MAKVVPWIPLASTTPASACQMLGLSACTALRVLKNTQSSDDSIFLPQFPKFWDDRDMPPGLATSSL